MKLIILLCLIILPFFRVDSQETIIDLFAKKITPTPELIKKWKANSKVDKSYDFVRYKIVNDILFDKISELAFKSAIKKVSKESLEYISSSDPVVSLIKHNGVTYLEISFDPFHKFEQPLFPMAQPAGFVSYKGHVYELIFWNKDINLFVPTKEIKRVSYKKGKKDIYVRFESVEIYLEIKGNEVKEINGSTIIK